MTYLEYKRYFGHMRGSFLAGQTAVVTGAARGIGAATAKLFGALGAKVVCAYLGYDEGAHETKKAIEAAGSECVLFKGDLSVMAEAERLKDFTISSFGSIDILVNNLGINEGKRFLDVTSEDWDKFLTTNLKSQFHTCHYFAPLMMEKRSGKIVNLTSVAGKEGALGPGAQYSASKGGIIGFTRSLAIELAGYGVNVNTFCPGSMDTQMVHWRTPEQLDEYVKSLPMGRLGTAEEAAWGIAYLAAPFASGMCGYLLDVNGAVHID
ncbi:MAG: SDR family oxidoreductase [Oscillospiraceae bacterium]|nr:SDR family oxidoreductase [Oscillospiraceae bacterium]